MAAYRSAPQPRFGAETIHPQGLSGTHSATSIGATRPVEVFVRMPLDGQLAGELSKQIANLEKGASGQAGAGAK
jgi:hypothetical protein